MSGRIDYEERKQRKLERYIELANKASKKSKEYSRKYNKIANAIPAGQPILVDHYSANKHIKDIKRMDSAIEKSIKENKKSEYYEGKAESIENNTVISSDDPNAIRKLEKKLEILEKRKLDIKAREHEWYELPYINADIKRVKERIKQLEELDSLDFKDITFNGGKVIHNKEINRVQILFDNIPSEETRTILKRRGFKWSRNEKAWQRLFNKNGIYAAKCVIEQIDIVHSSDNALDLKNENTSNKLAERQDKKI